MLKGEHLIAGEWVGSETQFESCPVHGPVRSFAEGSVPLVDKAVEAAESAFSSFGWSSRLERAALLRAVAEEIDARGQQITQIGCEETGLPEARLEGERGRTIGQLRLFADHIEKGDYLDVRHDHALPDRSPAPRPELYTIQRPIGPVAVFGASNFPLAFSVAGGDTASALAAGCPVIVKGHPAHPGTGELVAQAVDAAIQRIGLNPGVFSLVQSGQLDVGQRLVEHPLVRAVGFTGSLAGGRALFDLCANREHPIPFFGELGSVNPVFVMPQAAIARIDSIATGWANSLTLGVGQFCTNPGIVVVQEGDSADQFESVATAALSEVSPQSMLTEAISSAYRAAADQTASRKGVRQLLGQSQQGRVASPHLFSVSGRDFLNDAALESEVFGPLGLVVRAADKGQMLEIARKIDGQLTCTVHYEQSDLPEVREILPILERKAGRLVANAFPTGVEVSDSMVHGGPYPASTNFGATSVGTLAIRRFLRPVCYQDIPTELIPELAD